MDICLPLEAEPAPPRLDMIIFSPLPVLFFLLKNGGKVSFLAGKHPRTMPSASSCLVLGHQSPVPPNKTGRKGESGGRHDAAGACVIFLAGNGFFCGRKSACGGGCPLVGLCASLWRCWCAVRWCLCGTARGGSKGAQGRAAAPSPCEQRSPSRCSTGHMRSSPQYSPPGPSLRGSLSSLSFSSFSESTSLSLFLFFSFFLFLSPSSSFSSSLYLCVCVPVCLSASCLPCSLRLVYPLPMSPHPGIILWSEELQEQLRHGKDKRSASQSPTSPTTGTRGGASKTSVCAPFAFSSLTPPRPSIVHPPTPSPRTCRRHHQHPPRGNPER